MTPWFLAPSNAGSRTHEYGRRAKEAVEQARAQVAAVAHAKPEEIVVTSGATESNNLALLGLRRFGEESNRRHILSTAIEHKAVLEPLEQLSQAGFEVELASPRPRHGLATLFLLPSPLPVIRSTSRMRDGEHQDFFGSQFVNDKLW